MASKHRRTFSRRERTALFLVADGSCSVCGATLEKGWHADHIHPWHAGGATDVGNGQALCPQCNRKKGGAMESNTTPITTIRAKPKVSVQVQSTLPPWTLELRPWQDEARARYNLARDTGQQNFLLVATPGAGKTIAAARLAYSELYQGPITRLVVLVPTSHLRKQWAKALARVGIDIDPDWKNGDLLARDYCGVAVTYQQVAADVAFHRSLTSKQPTMLIADEIHHAGDDRSWGEGIIEAFEHAHVRLLLSGTPFRSDRAKISWVDYVPSEDGTKMISQADYTFGYTAALTADQVRPVMFPAYEGRMTWSNGLTEQQATFGDELPESEARKRLRTALDTEGNWIQSVCREAHACLCDIRENGHPSAGGLLLAKDDEHAKALAKIMKRLTGTTPIVAGYKDPDASGNIERFTRNTDPWLIAVKMVSEGVDIPRLRVAVYATNVISELFFRQVIGRIVRKVPEIDDQVAYLYIPAERKLIEFAEAVKKERDHVLEEETERLKRELERSKEPPILQETLHFSIGSEAYDYGTIIDGETVSPADIQNGQRIAQQYNFPLSFAARLALVLRNEGHKPAHAPPVLALAPALADEPEPAKYQRKQQLRTQLEARIRKYAMAQVSDSGGAQGYNQEAFREAKKLVAYNVNRYMDVQTVREADEEQLQRGNDLVQQWITEHVHGK